MQIESLTKRLGNHFCYSSWIKICSYNKKSFFPYSYYSVPFNMEYIYRKEVVVHGAVVCSRSRLTVHLTHTDRQEYEVLMKVK